MAENNPTIQFMRANRIPLTREAYLYIEYFGTPPETTEEIIWPPAILARRAKGRYEVPACRWYQTIKMLPPRTRVGATIDRAVKGDSEMTGQKGDGIEKFTRRERRMIKDIAERPEARKTLPADIDVRKVNDKTWEVNFADLSKAQLFELLEVRLKQPRL